ncbi:MAG: Ig-like domain-containing protein [Opitutaceae bacterium]
MPIQVVTPIGALPTVRIVNPVPNSSFSAGVETNIIADATDADGFITKVEFYINGSLTGTVLGFPYSVAWKPEVAGVYNIVALAYDDKSNAVSSTPAVITVKAGFPTIEIANPTTGAAPIIQGSHVAVTVRAAGSDGGITSLSTIALLIDGIASDGLPKNPANQDPPPPLSEPFVFDWASNVALGTHKISARVTDNNGLSITSAEVSITVIANLAPEVSITNLVDGIELPMNQVFSINADAIDRDGSVAKVEFNVNGTQIASVTSLPFSATYKPLAAGTYTVQAVATDNLGKTGGSAVISVVVKPPIGESPYVGLHINEPKTDFSLTPAAPAVPAVPTKVEYGSTLLLCASALDVDGTIAKVEFYGNGHYLGVVTEYPYLLPFYVNGVGSMELIAVATDNDGNKVSSTPVQINALPVTGTTGLNVSLASPQDGATYVAGEQITFSVNTNIGAASKPSVDIYVNGSQFQTLKDSPYQYVIGLSVPGTYQIRAVVRIDDFTTISVPAHITIKENTPPAISVTSPFNNASAKAGAAVKLAASASDVDGAISSVEFFENGMSAGIVKFAPFQLSWTPPAEGTYKITANATDSSGAVTSSKAVVLNVSGSGSDVSESVYNGTLSDKSWRLSLMTLRDNTAVFIAQSLTDSSKVLRYTGVQVQDGGLVIVKDGSDAVVLQATVSDTGFWGAFTYAGTSTQFILTATIPGSIAVSPALYSGSVDGRTGSVFAAMLGSDGTLIGYLGDANAGESGTAKMASNGSFRLVLPSGAIVAGSIDSYNGFLSGTVTGSRSGTLFVPMSLGSTGTASFAYDLYAGSVQGRLDNCFTGKRTLDDKMVVTLVDGGSRETGIATLSSAGSFALTLPSGNRISASIDSSTAYLSGTVTGSVAGTLTANYSSGIDPSDSSLRGLSTRGWVGTGDQILIAGFIIDGAGNKSIIQRSLGPSLALSGVGGVLANPSIQVYSLGGNLIAAASNDDWVDTAIIRAALSSVSLAAPSSTLEAVSYTSLPTGGYTSLVRGVGSTTGNGMIEFYDADAFVPSATLRLRAISSRGYVGTGDNVLIAGFIVKGTTPLKVLVQAVGPTLASMNPGLAGCLQDPMVFLNSISLGKEIRENDNWDVGNDPADVNEAANRMGGTPLAAGSKDATILLKLQPGIYTATVRGRGNSTGIALIQVYEVR